MKVNKQKIENIIALLKPKLNQYKVHLIVGFSVLVVIAVVFSYVKITSTGESKLSLSFASSEQNTLPLYALNRHAKEASVKKAKSSYAYFSFTKQQKELVANEYNQNNGAALALTILVEKLTSNKIQTAKTTEQPFSFGFLYPEDFKDDNKLKEQIESRPLVNADLSHFASTSDSTFTVSFCFEKTESDQVVNLPCGFFVYSVLPVKIQSAQITMPLVGWQKNPLYFAFAPNGGKVTLNLDSFDFSGASSVFSTQNTKTNLMPEYQVFLEPQQALTSSQNDELLSINLTIGGEKLTVYRSHSSLAMEKTQIPTAGLSSAFSNVSLGENSNQISAMFMTSSDSRLLEKKEGNSLYPYVCDPGLIFSWKATNWRGPDYELFEWAQFPGVLYMDTRSYSIQNDFFRRLAYFVEKAGYRGKLLTDVQLQGMLGYNAHDYRAASLADFFTTAKKLGFALNKREYLLRDILLANGVILENNEGFYDEGVGAIISISQESQPYLRRTFVAHEGWHGIFFTDADYRNAVAAVYYTMDPISLDFLHGYWSSQPGLQYDLSDTYLMHNELMAYLMQQPLSQLVDYYVRHAQWPSVQRNQKDTADYIIRTKAAGLEDAAIILNSYAFDHWGFSAGRVWLVNR